jgi:hypothetical protein
LLSDSQGENSLENSLGSNPSMKGGEVFPFSLDKRKRSWFKWFGFESPSKKPPTEKERQGLIQLTINGLLQGKVSKP